LIYSLGEYVDEPATITGTPQVTGIVGFSIPGADRVADLMT
jgi:hypothetical protein